MKPSEEQLRDEIALREASLVDARREAAAGELSWSEVAAIESRERDALASARRTLEALAATPAPTRPRRRRWLLVAALGCFLAVAVVLAWSSLAPRQAGNSITGSISLGRAQQIDQLLGEAEADLASGNVVAALSAYQQVLALSPTNVSALTEIGWLDFSAGSSKKNAALIALGVKELRRAIGDGPRVAAPRLYYAIVADSTPGNQALARAQFKIFLSLHPSSGQLAVAAPFLRQLGLSSS